MQHPADDRKLIAMLNRASTIDKENSYNDTYKLSNNVAKEYRMPANTVQKQKNAKCKNHQLDWKTNDTILPSIDLYISRQSASQVSLAPCCIIDGMVPCEGNFRQ